MSKVLPWSWSTLSAYRTCPKQFYELRIAKSVKEPDSPHLVWGNHFHKQMELGVSSGIPLTGDMQKWEPLRQQLVAAPGKKYTEQKLAVDSNFEPCDFFDKGGYSRGVDDLVIKNGPKILSIDYKTGKEGKFSMQLALSAARLFAHHPDVNEVSTAYYWSQTGKWTKAVYVRNDATGIWEDMREDVQQMLWSEENNVWPAKPSGLCKRSKRPGSTYMGCPVTNCPHSQNYKKP